MTIKLILPTEKYKEQILGYKQDFIANGDSMDGTAGLSTVANFEIWLENIHKNSNEETVLPNLVPATTYLAFNKENKLVGMIDIRHRLNDYLLKTGGHIGYSVLKSERRKGIATAMLNSALEKCKKLGIEKVLVTCDKENIGSAKTIKNCGGVLENEVEDNDRATQRYWINS